MCCFIKCYKAGFPIWNIILYIFCHFYYHNNLCKISLISFFLFSLFVCLGLFGRINTGNINETSFLKHRDEVIWHLCTILNNERGWNTHFLSLEIVTKVVSHFITWRIVTEWAFNMQMPALAPPLCMKVM